MCRSQRRDWIRSRLAGPQSRIQCDRQWTAELGLTRFLVRPSCDLSGWFQLVSDLGRRQAGDGTASRSGEVGQGTRAGPRRPAETGFSPPSASLPVSW
jgi:hypothetical protein